VVKYLRTTHASVSVLVRTLVDGEMPFAFVMMATEASKTSEDCVLTQLRKLKYVKEARSVFDVYSEANIAAIVESERSDELRMVVSFIGGSEEFDRQPQDL